MRLRYLNLSLQRAARVGLGGAMMAGTSTGTPDRRFARANSASRKTYGLGASRLAGYQLEFDGHLA